MKLTKACKKKIENLDFYYVEQTNICKNLYRICYAKDMANDESQTGEILSDSNRVAFYSEFDCDHRTVIKFENILMKGLLT